MAFLQLKDVSKSYGAGDARADVLRNVNLSVEEGEFVAIVGFSGSGKTTLMNLLSGLEAPDSGEVLMDGEVVAGPSPDRGLVFQSYSLMPWLSVYDNVRLAVDAVFQGKSKLVRSARARRYIEMVGLDHALDRRPAELSGGMRQRVAVARALAMSPKVLLMDEPLSALDALTRSKLQDEITDIWAREKKTVILVTNDVDEAILLADRIIPLTTGPGATLDKAFNVDLPRPRERAAMNNDDAFKALRRDVTERLIAIGIDTSSDNDAPAAPKVAAKVAGGDRAAATTSNDDAYLHFKDMAKVYPTPNGPLTVVEDINLTLRKGEMVSLIGHSGCGKSTALTMAAGLNSITRGQILLDGQPITGAGPDKAVVFQSPSLFPWLSAKENVTIGLEQVMGSSSKAERSDVAEYYLKRVGLGDALNKRASELSNGMKQRVGIARAFALNPKLLLLDEPFGMLDSLTRWELQEVLMDVWRDTKVTAVCVTHDVDEAILLADRVVMMTNGPRARIGNIMKVDLPHPRSRKALLEHADYYRYREELLTFLERYEGGANPDEDDETTEGDDDVRLVAAE